jgi:DNA-binding NarL/FixJ family response regulator
MSRDSINIAMADDHTIVRKGIIELINSWDEFHVIIEAVNGQDLINKLEKAAVIPDVCILDIQMPVLNGYQTAPIVRERWPSVKILALSMLNNEFTIIQMLRAGAVGYIPKEIDPTELRKAILSVYKYSFYHSELVSGRLMHLAKTKNSNELGLTENEWQFLSLCCTDLTYKDIAQKMQLSPRTVEGYRDTLFEKLDVRSRSGLVVFAIKMGLNG